ncbi:M protein, serotype 49 [Lates calcarifer]|uniref:M protein, serotype 49 n=1 Tax=Lates calcarifer TaxID=8187 RepID=A0AAJ8DKD2_LATCA|nr:M protein, serotype 49 [Lates calcarifer]
MENKPMKDSTVQEDKTSAALREENTLLKEKLLDAQFKQNLAECRLAAAKNTIAALQGQLKEARGALVSKIANVDQKMNDMKQRLGQVIASKSAANKNRQDKYQWIRTHRDQEQQTDDQLKKQQEKDLDAAKYQEETEDLRQKIQELKDKLSNEEALRKVSEAAALEMKNKLQGKIEAAKEATLKVGELQQEVQKIRQEAQEELSHVKTSYITQLEELKRVNADIAAAQKTTEEQLASYKTQWQQERASLKEALQLFQESQEEKQEEWSRTEAEMTCRMKYLESLMKEMLEKKARRRRGWFARHFMCSGSQ